LNELPSIEEFEKLAGDIEIGEDETTSEEASLPFEDTTTATEDGAPSVTADSSSAQGETVRSEENNPSNPLPPTEKDHVTQS
jgi:hypothetical protein